MTFPISEVRGAWTRSGGTCECRRSSHNHPLMRCNKQLIWENRGNKLSQGKWEVKTMFAGGPATKSNCAIFCYECFLLECADSKTDLRANPAADSRADPKTDSRADPAVDPRADPRADPAVDSRADPRADLAADSRADPTAGRSVTLKS